MWIRRSTVTPLPQFSAGPQLGAVSHSRHEMQTGGDGRERKKREQGAEKRGGDSQGATVREGRKPFHPKFFLISSSERASDRLTELHFTDPLQHHDAALCRQNSK